MGTVFKQRRKTKTVWAIDFKLSNGRRKRLVVGDVRHFTKKDAQKKLFDYEDQIIKGRNKNIVGQKLKLMEFGTRVINHKVEVLEQSTEKRQFEHLENIKRYFGDIELVNIDAESIDKYKEWRLKDNKSKNDNDSKKKTINNELSTLSSIYTIGIRWDYFTTNPVRKARKFKIEDDVVRQKRNLLDLKDQKKFLDNCHLHLRYIVEFLLNTGCRIGEALTLKWEQVDFEKREIYLLAKDTKTKLSRIVYMNKVLYKLLTTIKNHKYNEEWVFVNTKYTPYKNHDCLNSAWRGAVKRSGITHISAHSIRHTCATRLGEYNKEFLPGGYSIA